MKISDSNRISSSIVMEPTKNTNPISVGTSNKQGYIVAEIHRGTNELEDYTIHHSRRSVRRALENLWNTFYFDSCEFNDWELEKLPNGFTNGYTDYVVMSPEEFHSIEYAAISLTCFCSLISLTVPFEIPAAKPSMISLLEELVVVNSSMFTLGFLDLSISM